MDWAWWDAELATVITRSQSPNFHVWGYMKKHSMNTRDKLIKENFNAWRYVNDDAVLCEVTLFMVKWVRMCIWADGGHFEHLLNWSVQYFFQ